MKIEPSALDFEVRLHYSNVVNAVIEIPIPMVEITTMSLTYYSIVC